MTTTDIRRVAVVVPACNEQDNISATLLSIQVAQQRLNGPRTSGIVVVADACVDDTAALARRACDGVHDVVLTTHHGNVGSARRRGAGHALSAFPHDPRRLWIASTDADTLVGTDWLTIQLDLARHGIVGVAGTVALRSDAPTTLRQAFTRSYRLAPDGSHEHVHGANMGVRGDAYLQAGGWSGLATGEDHDLWRRLAGVGPLISTTAMAVRTSPRRQGRAPAGFADDMAMLHGIGA